MSDSKTTRTTSSAEARAALPKKKKKARRSRFSSLRSLRSKKEEDMIDSNENTVPIIEALPDSVTRKLSTPPSDSPPTKKSSPETEKRTKSEPEIVNESVSPTISGRERSGTTFSRMKKKIGETPKRFPSLRTSNSRRSQDDVMIQPKPQRHTLADRRERANTVFAPDGSLVDGNDPFPGIALKEEAPFPGINLRGSSGDIFLPEVRFPGALESTGSISSMPSKRVSSNIIITTPKSSLKQLREELKLPGTVKHSRIKKYKNLANYSKKSSPRIESLDKVKLAPLFTSKTKLRLEYISSENHLVKADFLADFPDNIREIDFSSNLIEEFPPISHLSSLKRLTLNGNRLKNFSTEGLDGLLLLSIANNRITSIPKLHPIGNLINLDLHGNKIKNGFSELCKLKSLMVLDMSRCMLEMTLEKFKEEILSVLKELPLLEYLCIGDNPICTQYPELKYIIIDELPNLQYYDYQIITQELRLDAPQVKEHGIIALQQSYRERKEEIRLNAEKQSSKVEDIEKDKLQIAIDLTLDLPKELLNIIFSFLTPNEIMKCSLVCKRWNEPAITLYRSLLSNSLRKYSIIVGPIYYKSKYNPLLNELKQSSMNNVAYDIYKVTNLVETFFEKEKFVLLLINRGKTIDFWDTLYQQLSHRLCKRFNDEYQFKYLKYAIYELDNGSLASGIDSLLQTAGGKRVIDTGNTNSISFGIWVESLQNNLSKYFKEIQQNVIVA